MHVLLLAWIGWCGSVGINGAASSAIAAVGTASSAGAVISVACVLLAALYKMFCCCNYCHFGVAGVSARIARWVAICREVALVCRLEMFLTEERGNRGIINCCCHIIRLQLNSMVVCVESRRLNR